MFFSFDPKTSEKEKNYIETNIDSIQFVYVSLGLLPYHVTFVVAEVRNSSLSSLHWKKKEFVIYVGYY